MPRTVVDLAAADQSPVATPNIKLKKDILLDAIYAVNKQRLCSVLMGICDKNPMAFQLTEKLLLIPEEKVMRKVVDKKNMVYDETDEEEDKGDEESEESVTNERRCGIRVSFKRMRSRYAMCENCSEEYDVTANFGGDCMWHPGKS